MDKPEGNIPLRKPTRRLEDNIKKGRGVNGVGERGMDSSGSG